MSVFDSLMTDRVVIRTQDGKVFSDVPAAVQSNLILVERVDIPIRIGDEVLRRTAAGVEECFIVEDPGYHAKMLAMPAAYQLRVRRADARKAPRAEVVYNITGANARFNVNSVDTSTNVVSQAPSEFFTALREAIQSQITDLGRRNELLERTADLERESGTPAFATRYARFMELAANHMEVLAPFMPALAQMLTGIQIS